MVPHFGQRTRGGGEEEGRDEQARAEVLAEAQAAGLSARDYASTLLCAVISDDLVAVAQLGDGLAVAAVLHQPDLARRFSDRVLGLAGGRLVFDSSSAEVDDETVAGLYRPALEALEAAEERAFFGMRASANSDACAFRRSLGRRSSSSSFQS